MNAQVESFWEYQQEKLSDLVNKLEEEIDVIVYMIENKEFAKQEEKLQKMYTALGNLKQEIF